MTDMERPAEEVHPPYDFMKMNEPKTATNVHVYLNGDRYYPGRKFVVNRRYIPDFTGFLNQVTIGIKAPFGAVRNIYTPQAGHRVSDLDQLQPGMQIVAGGVEKFRKLDYKEIGARRRPKPKRNYLDIKIHNRMNVSARWRKYVKDPCQIFVYGNGDLNAPALKLLLIPRCMKTWDLVLEEITEKISIRTGQAVRKLYDMDYRLLGDPSELESGQYYVAVGNEKLKKYPYGEIHKQNSPRKHATHQHLPPIKRASKARPPLLAHESADKTYTNMYAQKHNKSQSEEETTVMGASAANGYKPLKAKMTKPQKPPQRQGLPAQETDGVFLGKPVKVKRSGGKGTGAPTALDPHPPYDEADGVYKQKTREIRAAEVDEAQDIKVDLPIDQIPAGEVEEEHIRTSRSEQRSSRSEREANSSRERSTSRAKTPSREKTPYPEKLPSEVSTPREDKIMLGAEQFQTFSNDHLFPSGVLEDKNETGDEREKTPDVPLTPVDVTRSPVGEPRPASHDVYDVDDMASSLASTGRGLSVLGTSPKENVSGIEIDVESPTLEDITTATDAGEQVLLERDRTSSRQQETEQDQEVSNRPETVSLKSKSDRVDSVQSRPESKSPGGISPTIAARKDASSNSRDSESPNRNSVTERALTPTARFTPDKGNVLEVEQHHNIQDNDKTSPTLTGGRLSSATSPLDSFSQPDQSATEELTTESHDDGTNRKSTASPSLTLDESTTKKDASEYTEAFSEAKTVSSEPDESETTDTAAKIHPKPFSSEPSKTSENPTSTSQEVETLDTSTMNGGVATRLDLESPSIEYDRTSALSPSQKRAAERSGSAMTRVEI